MARQSDVDKYGIKVGLETDQASIKTTINEIKTAIKSLNSVSSGESEAGDMKEYDSIIANAKHSIGKLMNDMQKLTSQRESTRLNTSIGENDKNLELGNIDKSFNILSKQYKQLDSLLSKLESQAKATKKELGSLGSKGASRKSAYNEWLSTGILSDRVENTALKKGPKQLYEEAKENVTRIAKLQHENYEATRKETLLQKHKAKELDKQYKIELGITKEKKKQNELTSYIAVGLFKRIAKAGINTFKALTMAGSDYLEINSRFNRILGEGASIAEDSAKRIADAYGRDLTEVKDNFTSIYTILRNSNLEMRTSIALSSNLTAIANELASVWDTDVDQAVNAVISGLQGLPKAMKTYGVYLTQSEIKEYLVEAGMVAKDFNGEFDSGQRTLATYLKLMKDAGYAIHDFANTQYSVANQLRILQSSFTGIKRTLGSMMNSVLSPILQAFNYILKVINSLLNELNSLPEPLKFVIGLFVSLATLFPIIVGGFVVTSYFGRIWREQLKRIAEQTAKTTLATKMFNKTLVWVSNNWKKIMLWGSVFFLFITSLVGIINDLTKKEEENKNAINESKNAAKDYMRTLAGFDDVNVLSFSNKEDSQTLNFENVSDINALNEQFEEMLNGASGGIAEISEQMGAWKAIILGITGALMSFKTAAIITNVISNWDKYKKTIKGVWDKLKGATSATKKFEKYTDAATKSQVSFGKALGASAIAVASVAYAITQISSIWKSDQPVWVKIVRTILVAVAAVAALAAAWNLVKSNYAGVAAAAGIAVTAGGINAALGSIEETKMAKGGVAVGGTRAIIGEGIYDEAVIPLGQSPQFSNMKSDIASAVVEGLAGANMSNGQPINITVNVDENYIYKAYNRQAKLYGRRI